MPQDFEANGVIDHISGLSSAEEIFTYLLLPYEQDVVNVSRLHIMKRMGKYLAEADMAGLDEDAVFLEARGALKRAYEDFRVSTPIKEKVFKVFKDEAEKLEKRFVGIDTLKVAAE